jgi:YggT family protein
MILQEPLIIILNSIGTLFIGAIWLRLLMQLSQVDYYNPMAQSVVKITGFIITPLRRVIPSLGRIDTASVLAAFLLTLILGSGTAIIAGAPLQLGAQILGAVIAAPLLLVKLCWWLLLIGVILSWFPNAMRHPVGSVIMQISGGLLSPLRRVMPDTGMIDLSPLIGLLGLVVLESLLINVLIAANIPPLYGWVM